MRTTMIFLLTPIALLAVGGCPFILPGQVPNTVQARLQGAWTLTFNNTQIEVRGVQGGETTSTFTTTVAGGDIPTISEEDAALPADLLPFVIVFNQQVAALNQEFDAAFPTQILISFQGLRDVEFIDANNLLNEAELTFEPSLGDRYVGLRGLNGDPRGNIQGTFDEGELSTTGQLEFITLVTIADGEGVQTTIFTITVDFTGHRTGDMPA